MKKLLLLVFILCASGYSVSQERISKEDLKNRACTNFLANEPQEKVFLLDSIHIYGRENDLKTRAFYSYNAENLEESSYLREKDYNGDENFTVKDSTYYDENKNVELYKYYYWQEGEWSLAQYTEYFRNETGREDSIRDFRFDMDLDEWYLFSQENYKYDQDNNLIEMIRAARDYSGEFYIDYKMEYSDFVGADKPQKELMLMYSVVNEEYSPYLNTFHDYNEKTNIISTVKKIILGGEETDFEKTEWLYNDRDQVSKVTIYEVPYGETEFTARNITVNIYDPETHYLVRDSNYTYYSYVNEWTLQTYYAYYWSEPGGTVSVDSRNSVNDVKLFYNNQTRQIQVQSDEAVKSIQIYNINGALAFDGKFQGTLTGNEYKYTLPAGNLSAGVYIIRLNTESKSISKNIIIHD